MHMHGIESVHFLFLEEFQLARSRLGASFIFILLWLGTLSPFQGAATLAITVEGLSHYFEGRMLERLRDIRELAPCQIKANSNKTAVRVETRARAEARARTRGGGGFSSKILSGDRCCGST